MRNENTRKTINERETIEVDGVQQRLMWIAENQPDILIKRYGQVHPRMSAYESVLIKWGGHRKALLIVSRNWVLILGYMLKPLVYGQMNDNINYAKKKKEIVYTFIGSQNLNFSIKSWGWRLDWRKKDWHRRSVETLGLSSHRDKYTLS